MKKLSILTSVIVAAWFLFLIYGMRVLFDYGIVQKSAKEENSEPDDRLISKLRNRIQILELKLEKSRKLKKSPKEIKIINNNNCNFSKFSFDRETARRRLHSGIKEFWFDVEGRFREIREKSAADEKFHVILDESRSKLAEHYRSLIADSLLLSKSDDAWNVRRQELNKMASIVRERIETLQNPKNCKEAKKILCNLNKGCGFGCQIHHAAYCFITAYSMNRTLILQSRPWSYSERGWTSVFLPLSGVGRNDDYAETSCINLDDEIREWSNKGQDSKIISLPIVDSLHPRPPQLPLAFPKELSAELLRLHGNPPAWFVGQFINYMWRLQPDLKLKLEKASEKMRFDDSPIVGVHVRRTDKVGSEASFHSLKEYMKYVDEWFDIQDTLNIKSSSLKFQPSNDEQGEKSQFSEPKKLLRRIYLATDDPKVVEEAKKMYTLKNGYEILADSQVASTASLGKRYSDPSLLGIIFDVHFLAKSCHLVCTFSSQVCRLAYELMQAEFQPSISLVDPDHAEDFRSLDDVYYFGGQSAHEQIAVLNHRSIDNREIELKIGDVVGVAGNHWDGYSKGQNVRTDLSGLYPSYKVKEYWRIEDFPVWPNST